MKKKSKRLLVFGVTVFLAAVSIMAVLIAQSSSPERRLKKQLESAERYLAELDYEQAIVAYRSAIEIDPKNEAAYVGLVDTYIAWADKVFLDNPEQAMDILEKAIEELERMRNEENAGLIDAQIDRIRRHMEELKSDGTQELTGTEEIEDPYVRLDAGEYEDVLEKYLAMLENDPTDPEIYLVIVEAYIRMGDYDKALEYAKLGYEKTGDERLKEKIDMIEGGNISDSSGRLIKMTWEEDGTVVWWHEYTYDKEGRAATTTVYDADGNQTDYGEYEYDADGNCIVSVGGYYSDDGTLVKHIEHYDENGRILKTEYGQNKDFWVFRVTEYQYRGNETDSYRQDITDYSRDGNVTNRYYEIEVSGDEGHSRSEEYRIEPDGKEWLYISRQLEYDDDGNISKNIYTCYNMDGGIDYQDTTTFEYDENGTLMRDATYDMDGNLIHERNYQ